MQLFITTAVRTANPKMLLFFKALAEMQTLLINLGFQKIEDGVQVPVCR
jgi:hypothetical protein